MKIYAFLPAKGHSERVTSKNNQILAGEKLYIRGLKNLLKCKNIDRVFLDTDSISMHNETMYLDCDHMLRDEKYANNLTDGHQLFMNEVYNYDDADIYVQYLCTSPFIRPSTIDKCIQYLIDHPQNDSVIFMKREKCYFWENNQPSYNINKIPNSKDLPYTVSESMGLYIIRKEAALSLKRRYGISPAFIYGDPIEYIDINSKEELELANIIAEGIKSKEIYKYNLLKRFISSASLSDLIDDIKNEKDIICGGVIPGMNCNLPGTTLFGRAKTLSLRPLAEGEDFRGIYSALESYNFISQNDIILVENKTPQFAYFGDLNTRLAIRSGAAGAIINSATRDIDRTRVLGFPVYSLSLNAQDVRRRATVESINLPICINNVVICPNDLVFADSDAIVIIKEKYIDIIISMIIEKISTENNISNDIIKGITLPEIVNKHGEF